MELKDLIEKGMEASSTFKQKYKYWTTIRKKKPDLEWLMPLLEAALGVDYVRKSAQDYIDGQKRES